MIHWKTTPILIALASLWLLPGLLFANADPNNSLQPVALQRLTSEMLANNQGLVALQQQVAALKEEVQAAGALDDPRLGLGLLNLPVDSFRFDKEPMTQKQITLAQRIPWFGKLDLKTQRAALNAVRLESALNARRLTLIRELTDAYYELGFVAVSLKINERMADLLDQIIRVTETRYASGKDLQQDVLQAQVEQSRLMDQHNILQGQRRTIEARINGLLNRGTFASIAVPTPDDLPDLDGAVATWKAIALDSNPDVHTRRVEIDQARVDIDLSRKAYYPDPDLRLAYGQRDEDPNGNNRSDFVSALVVVNLPLWAKRKQAPKYEAAVKRRDAAQAQFRDLIAQLPHQVDAVAAELHQLRQNYTLYQEATLIQAAQWAESARFSYEVGKVNFNTMISAQLQELRIERQANKFLYQYYRKMAALDRLLGGRLTASASMTPSNPETGGHQQARMESR